MESFQLLRMHLAMCGIEISQKSTSAHPFNVRNSTVFSLVCVTVSLITVSINEADTFDDYTDILFRSISNGACGILYEIIVWKTSVLHEFINRLADIVSARLEHPDSQALYTEASQKMEKWIRILHSAVKVTPILVISSAVIGSFFTYFSTDLDDSAFKLPNPMWFPFDTQNPSGFLVAISIQCIFYTSLMVTLKCLAIFGIGTCFMLFPLANDIKSDLKAINDNAKRIKDRPKIVNQFFKFVQFHSELIQLIHDYSDFSDSIFLIIFICSIAAICAQMLLLNIMDTINSLDIIIFSLQMFYLFAPIFGVCEFGERLYGTFEEINAVYNQFAWYSFPYNVQQMLPILIMVAQNPIELRVFGSIACGRITLQNVINRAYSWYMVLRRFGN